MSIKGVYLGFFLPANMLAASVAKRPRVLPLASSTNHLRVISCELGKYVDIVTSSPRGTFVRARVAHQRKNLRLATALPANERFRSLEWRRLDFERFQRESLKALLRVRFPGRLPGLAQSSDRFAVKWLPGLTGTSPRRIRRRLQTAGRGTAQEVQSNAFGQGSQRGWSHTCRTKEAFSTD